jgi:limonene 1,2-monooxygenase
MARIKFGTFLAPHHPIGESPTMQFQRDLDLAANLDRLGFDEFWVGEHHSTGWEMIASPEMFLAAAGQRTHTIKLGTGVVSLPYHHPFNVAQRMVQLDHMTRGRVIFGSGPGALPSDAYTLNIDPMTQRDRQDEALGVIIKLLRGDDRFDYECQWFTLRDAALQILPYQETMPMACASSISPSGMQLAGKYGIGALSIASTSKEGIQALPTQWGFAEEAAQQHGQTVTRDDWRVLMSWHIAETREQARNEAVLGLQKWHNEYNVDVLGRPGAQRVENAWDLMDQVAAGGAEGGGAAVVGTPDDLIEAVINLQEVTGGFGTVLGFAHDWATPEQTARSWDLVARYVVPAVNGHLTAQRASAAFVAERKSQLMAGASAAVMSKIMSHQGASAAMATTMQQMAARNAAASGPENDPVFRPGGGLPTDAPAQS